jgi:predicted transposase/invertase (TIGR01784 family)
MAYNKDELSAYEDFWDKMGAERLFFVDSAKINLERGLKQGRAEGEHAKALEIANKLLKAGMPIASISEMTGLTQAEIEGL